jgi:hypothetical protein
MPLSEFYTLRPGVDAENKEPLFPFGFGLSYTSFSYSQLKTASGAGVTVTFNVRNAGKVAGADSTPSENVRALVRTARESRGPK